MKKPKGPELKMPEVKVPQFAADVYYDLRDRRLLPLVALLVVAIAAVPFLLGGDAEEAQPPTAERAGQSAVAASAARLTVVQGKPGLRDYRKRLRERSATDPFKQRYTSLPEAAQLKSVEVPSAAGGSGAGLSSESVTEIDESVTEVEEQGSSPGAKGNGGGTSPSGGAGPPEEGLEGGRLYGFRPDLRFGVAGSGELQLHDELPLGSLLPEKNPLLVFVGVTQNGKRALFSLTTEVTMVRGNGDCVGGSRNCRILSIQAGQAVDIVTDQPGRAFRLAVERIEFVALPPPQAREQASGSRAGGPGGGRIRGLAQDFSN